MWLTKVRERKLQKGKIISTVWMRIDIEKLFCLCKKHKNVCVYIYIWRNAIKAKCAINSCSNEDMEMIGRTHYGRTAATHFTMSLYLVWKVLLVFSSICTERHFAAGDFLRDHLLGFFCAKFAHCWRYYCLCGTRPRASGPLQFWGVE